jgi:hypothetical protein
MSRMFQRACRLRVGDILIRDLDVSFRIQKSLRARRANTAEIFVYNLNEDHRRELAAAERVMTRLEAGHGDSLFQIFAGELRRARSYQQGTNWVTEIRNRDGHRAMRTTRLAQTFRGRVDLERVLEAAVEQVTSQGDIGAGNVMRAMRGRALESGATSLRAPVLFGSAYDWLVETLRSAGLEVSIQDSELLALPVGQALDVMVELNVDSGLQGSPDISNDKKGYRKSGLLTCRSLLQSDLDPGRKVHVVSKMHDVIARIDRAEYVGDTRSDTEWYVDIEGKPL